MGRSLAGSKVVCGMMCKCKPEGVVKCVTRVKVAIFMPGLDIAQTETKGTVLLRNAKEMLNFTSGEEKYMDKVSVAVTCPLSVPTMHMCRFSRRS